MATPFRLKRSAISGKRPQLGDLQLGELALNFYDGYLFAKRETEGVGIADTVSLLTPWIENYGGASIFYEQSVGIGTTNPTETLTVFGNSYVSGNFNTQSLFASTITSNNGIFTSFNVLGISTFGGDVDINAALDVDGHTELDELQVTGVSTFTADLDINAAIDVDGHTELDELNVSGVSTFSNTTDNTLGDADTGAFQIDGGLGVNKNVTIGGNLDVQGYSNFVGVVTFRGGTINIGDANTDNVNIGGEFISNLVPNDDDSYDIGITTQRWRNGIFSGIVTTTNLYASGITTTGLLNIGIGGTIFTTTESGLIGINSTAPTVALDVGGTINSSTDVTINGASVLTTATSDAVALAIALG